MTKLKTLLQQLYSDAGFAASISPFLFPTSISAQQGEFLQKLLRRYRPKVLIELGFGYGVSSLWLQTAITKPHKHYIVDPHRLKGTSDVIFTTLKKQPSIIFNQTLTSQQFLAQYSRKNELADFIFVDADEKFDGVMTDLYFAFRCLTKGGIVVIRNMWNPSVKKAVYFYLRNLPVTIPGVKKWQMNFLKRTPFRGKWYLHQLTKDTDFCVLQLTGKDRRHWNHFVNF